jgi:hypothetical protein
MKVLIVAKTRMRNAVCVGGFATEDGKSLRLLQRDGTNQPTTTDYEIGQLWDLSVQARQSARPPHTEDVLVLDRVYIGTESDVRGLLMAHARIETEEPEDLFDGLLEIAPYGSAFIVERRGVPGYSTAFWVPRNPLTVVTIISRTRYEYTRSGIITMGIPYVGLAPAERRIGAGTLVRLSLARWWRPQGATFDEERCYLQLSGWY